MLSSQCTETLSTGPTLNFIPVLWFGCIIFSVIHIIEAKPRIESNIFPFLAIGWNSRAAVGRSYSCVCISHAFPLILVRANTWNEFQTYCNVIVPYVCDIRKHVSILPNVPIFKVHLIWGIALLSLFRYSFERVSYLLRVVQKSLRPTIAFCLFLEMSKTYINVVVQNCIYHQNCMSLHHFQETTLY